MAECPALPSGDGEAARHRGRQLPGKACQVASTVPWAGQSPEGPGRGPHAISGSGICWRDRQLAEAVLSRLSGPGDRPEQTPGPLLGSGTAPSPPSSPRPASEQKGVPGTRRGRHLAPADSRVEAQHGEGPASLDARPSLQASMAGAQVATRRSLEAAGGVEAGRWEPCPVWGPQVCGDIFIRARAALSCPGEACTPALSPGPHARARPEPEGEWPRVHPPTRQDTLEGPELPYPLPDLQGGLLRGMGCPLPPR